jgi:hypothetical protein
MRLDVTLSRTLYDVFLELSQVVSKRYTITFLQYLSRP